MTAMRLKRYPSLSGGIALGKMGVGATMLKQGKTAKDYVQTGLVAMWDGIENAGWGTHDPNATTWKDLVGSNHVELNNASSPNWMADAYQFDETGYFYKSTSSLLPLFQSKNFSVEVCRSDYYIGSNKGFMTVGTDQGGQKRTFMVFDGANPIKMDNAIVLNGGFTANLSSGITTSPWSGVRSFTCTSGTYTMATYTDAVAGASEVMTGSNIYTASDLWIGKISYYSGNTVIKGKIHNLRLYNRALTATEIAANYAIDKERFNLP